ncbi:hypothetical protein HII31_06638 [Pseudocercospora fuligena]|uniref:Uncharacterized protein n=1 Tax=Pseudocercospora fuligena TaxID=685502 RepID=A0A8H6RJH1_9PEZI|nr:hypothetical protein HII31_06638 [Pseudocercospora fuligena]
MSNETDHFTLRPPQGGRSPCPPDCPRPSSSKDPVCNCHRPPTPRLGDRPSPLIAYAGLRSQRSSSSSPGPAKSPSPDPKMKPRSKTPAIDTISYSERLRKFLLFCVAVELNVEASLEKEEFLTKEELIVFVRLAQFYCAKCQNSNAKNLGRERELQDLFTDAAKEMGLDVRFAYSMLPRFIALMQPPSRGEKIYHRVRPSFWKSTLGQPEGDAEAWKLMTRLDIYECVLPQLMCGRINNPLLKEEFKAKIRNGEGEELSEKVNISIEERMKDAAKDLKLNVEECMERVRHSSSDEKSDSVTGVIDGKMPEDRGIPLPDPDTILPDLTIALDVADFVRKNDTSEVGSSGNETSSNRLIEFCSHAKMRAVWKLVVREHETRSDRRRIRATALTDNIKARGKKTVSWLSWCKAPTPGRLWDHHLCRKKQREARAQAGRETLEKAMECAEADEEQERTATAPEAIAE